MPAHARRSNRSRPAISVDTIASSATAANRKKPIPQPWSSATYRPFTLETIGVKPAASVDRAPYPIPSPRLHFGCRRFPRHSSAQFKPDSAPASRPAADPATPALEPRVNRRFWFESCLGSQILGSQPKPTFQLRTLRAIPIRHSNLLWRKGFRQRLSSGPSSCCRATHLHRSTSSHNLRVIAAAGTFASPASALRPAPIVIAYAIFPGCCDYRAYHRVPSHRPDQMLAEGPDVGAPVHVSAASLFRSHVNGADAREGHLFEYLVFSITKRSPGLSCVPILNSVVL